MRAFVLSFPAALCACATDDSTGARFSMTIGFSVMSSWMSTKSKTWARKLRKDSSLCPLASSLSITCFSFT